MTQMPPRSLARSPPTRRKNEPPITVILGGSERFHCARKRASDEELKLLAEAPLPWTLSARTRARARPLSP